MTAALDFGQDRVDPVSQPHRVVNAHKRTMECAVTAEVLMTEIKRPARKPRSMVQTAWVSVCMAGGIVAQLAHNAWAIGG